MSFSMFAQWIALAIAVLLLVAFALMGKRARLMLIAALPQSLLLIFVFTIAILLSACSGLTGSTSATSSNPTGLPLTSDKLSVSLPDFAAVNKNCAGGDTNSCVQKTKYLAFCKETSGNDEALTACTNGHWTEAIAAGAQ